MAKGKWKLVETEYFGYALECSICGHKMSIRDWNFGDHDMLKCPWCDHEMDPESIDEDELFDLVKGA